MLNLPDAANMGIVPSSLLGVVAQWCDPLTLHPEQSDGSGSIPSRAPSIELLAILQKSLDRALFLYINAGLDRVALELRSLLCTFQKSTNCSKLSFDSDSFQNS